MTILLNGEPLETQAKSLAEFMNEQSFAAAVASAVNEMFVPAGQRSTLLLNEGDRIEVLAPMQGG